VQDFGFRALAALMDSEEGRALAIASRCAFWRQICHWHVRWCNTPEVGTQLLISVDGPTSAADVVLSAIAAFQSDPDVLEQVGGLRFAVWGSEVLGFGVEGQELRAGAQGFGFGGFGI
jgi:hypothetical protein